MKTLVATGLVCGCVAAIISGCAESPPQPSTTAATWKIPEAIVTPAAGTNESQTVNGLTATVQPGDRPSELTTIYRVTFDRDASISNWGGDFLATANGATGNVYTYKQTVTPELANLNGMPLGLYFDITTNFYSNLSSDPSQWQLTLNGKYAGSGHLDKAGQTKIAQPGTKQGWTHTYRIIVIDWDALAKSGQNGTIGLDLNLVDISHTYQYHWDFKYHVQSITIPAGIATTAVRIPEQQEVATNGSAFSCQPGLSSAEQFTVDLVTSSRCKKEVAIYNVITGKTE